MVYPGIPLAANASIAIIGAGPTGISSFQALNPHFNVTVIDRNPVAGGVWARTSDGNDRLFDFMHTNHSRHLMKFREFPWDERIHSFPSMIEMSAYVQDVVRQLGMDQHARYKQEVVHVTKVEDGGWNVTSHPVDKPEAPITEHYDAVVLREGTSDKVNFPQDFEGQKDFPVPIIHTSTIRDVRDIEGKQHVLILGSRSSARDMALELSRIGTPQITMATRKLDRVMPETTQLSQVQRCPQIKAFYKDGSVEFENSSQLRCDKIQPDLVIFATGYKNDFSFLDPSSGLDLQQDVTKQLWKSFINIQEPTMIIMGDTPGTAWDGWKYAAQFITKIWLGEIPLPSKQEMLTEEAQRPRDRPTTAMRYEFDKSLAEPSGMLPIIDPRRYEILDWEHDEYNNPDTRLKYRFDNLIVHADGKTWEVVKGNGMEGKQAIPRFRSKEVMREIQRRIDRHKGMRAASQ